MSKNYESQNAARTIQAVIRILKTLLHRTAPIMHRIKAKIKTRIRTKTVPARTLQAKTAASTNFSTKEE